MKKLLNYTVLLLISCLLLCGCGKKNEEDAVMNAVDSGQTYIYYLNAEENGLEPVASDDVVKSQEVKAESINKLLKLLSMDPEDSNGAKASITEEMQVSYASFGHENVKNAGIVTLDIGNAFTEVDYSLQVLCKASIVYTLCQLDQVRGVSFTMNGNPYTDSKNTEKEFFTTKDFIMDEDSLYNNSERVTLYFSNSKGNKLVPNEQVVKVKGNESLEYAIIRTLRDTKSSDKMLCPLPEDLVIHSAYVFERTCFVDLGPEIYESVNGIDKEISIYSIVDSLLGIDGIDSVQFMVDGKLVQDMEDFQQFDQLFKDALKLFEE